MERCPTSRSYGPGLALLAPAAERARLGEYGSAKKGQDDEATDPSALGGAA